MTQPRTKRCRVTVVVLGDLGRSPRMLYHTLSLAAELADVDLVGYRGSALPRALAEHPRVRVHRLAPPRSLDPRRGPRIWVDALVRSIGQTLQLLRLLLFDVARPDVILVQSPPAVPTLGVAWLAARLRSARLVVDWHNFGYTLLGLKLGERHPLVTAMATYERLLGRLADAHLCVSRAMRAALEERWRLRRVRVVYDRPPADFAPAPLHRRHDLFRRLGPKLGGTEDGPAVAAAAHVERTLTTALRIPRAEIRGDIRAYCQPSAHGEEPVPAPSALEPFLELRPDRPAVLVSSTSWTPDEDFSLLVEAAERVDATIAGRPSFPRLLVLVTGRGPLRQRYEERFAALALRRVSLRTLWLSPQDYPLLLGAADLGLCFHRSSSALDLPMKLSDMLGAGLPVCAVDYGPVLAERLRPGENGLLFTSGEELARDIVELLEGFPGRGSRLAALRRAMRQKPSERWDPGWRAEARPTFVELLR